MTNDSKGSTILIMDDAKTKTGNKGSKEMIKLGKIKIEKNNNVTIAGVIVGHIARGSFPGSYCGVTNGTQFAGTMPEPAAKAGNKFCSYRNKRQAAEYLVAACCDWTHDRQTYDRLWEVTV